MLLFFVGGNYDYRQQGMYKKVVKYCLDLYDIKINNKNMWKYIKDSIKLHSVKYSKILNLFGK